MSTHGAVWGLGRFGVGGGGWHKNVTNTCTQQNAHTTTTNVPAHCPPSPSLEDEGSEREEQQCSEDMYGEEEMKEECQADR